MRLNGSEMFRVGGVRTFGARGVFSRAYLRLPGGRKINTIYLRHGFSSLTAHGEFLKLKEILDLAYFTH